MYTDQRQGVPPETIPEDLGYVNSIFADEEEDPHHREVYKKSRVIVLIDIELCHFVSSRSGTRIIRLHPPTHFHPSSMLSPPTRRTAITISLWYIAVDKKQDTIDWYWTVSRRDLAKLGRDVSLGTAECILGRNHFLLLL